MPDLLTRVEHEASATPFLVRVGSASYLPPLTVSEARELAKVVRPDDGYKRVKFALTRAGDRIEIAFRDEQQYVVGSIAPKES